MRITQNIKVIAIALLLGFNACADQLRKPDVEHLVEIAGKAISDQHPELDLKNISLNTVRYQYDSNLDGSVHEVFVVVFRMDNSVSMLNDYGEYRHIRCTRILVQIEPDGKVTRKIGITPTVSEIYVGKEKVVAMGRGGIEKWYKFRKRGRERKNGDIDNKHNEQMASGAGIKNKLYESEQSKTNGIAGAKQESDGLRGTGDGGCER